MQDNKNKRGNGVAPMPHDAVFKQFLTNPVTAKDFMQLHLPAWLQEVCDFSTLKLESGSYIEENLRPFYSDVIYSLQTTSGEGYIHVLIEHQSTPDRLMAFRLLRYAVAAMQRHLEKGHKNLPLVIPVLFYMGKRSPYPYSTNWLQLFDSPALAEKLYGNAFPVVDVTVIPDEEILNHRSIAALTLLQKHIHQRELSDMAEKLASLLAMEYMTGQQRHTLINYLVQTGETADATRFLEQLAQQVPQLKDEMMTIAQQLKQLGVEKGIEQGIQLGEQQGIAIGRKEEALKIARAMLARGLDGNVVMEMTGLSEDELTQIRH
ncbi:Rpn family recombination-promoting nuclease/putative transposase [Vagococcus sp. WN89Y]|uniref:Rpn family recombination-promoting nuclease/putative transposase n=1 Tax=Vagococcus sp. WN89Y TaxID=3457258 RepID=UPI003FCDB11F